MISFEKVDEAKQRLGAGAAFIIAEDLKLEQWNENKLSASSPFTHDNDPSFIWNPKNNSFKDFSSGRTYGIIDHYMAHYNLSYSEAVKRLLDETGMEYGSKEFSPSTKGYKGVKLAKDEPDNPRIEVDLYAMSRGISPKTLDYCNIKQAPNGDAAFQFMDQNNIHIATKYRKTVPCKKTDRFRWQISDVETLLYGVNRIDTNKAILVTEGLWDRVSCVEAGFVNAVSIPGGANDLKWIDYNWDFLESAKEIVLWFDNDETGETSVKKVANRLGEYRVRVVNVEPEIVEAVTEYYKKLGKEESKADANNVLLACGPMAVLKCIERAEIIENPRLKPLFDYEPVNIAELDRVSTGFSGLDKIITGNFVGNFVVLSGKSGEGKSTLVSEMGIVAPLEAGKKVMTFSGEANGGVLLGNMLRPFAGRNHILEWDNSQKGIPNSYSVTKDAAKEISAFYRDQIWNYEDGEEIVASSSEILKTMEYAYKRYEITHFVIDNMMCISMDFAGGDDEDKYNAQYKFALALKRFTRKYNTTVFLVAHSKKPAQGQKNVDMYSVSGASEVMNLADRGFSVSKVDGDPDGFNSKLFIMKDRVGGKANYSVKLRYDEATNRIYTDDKELFTPRRWEAGSKITYPPELQKRIVGTKKKITEAERRGIF